MNPIEESQNSMATMYRSLFVFPSGEVKLMNRTVLSLLMKDMDTFKTAYRYYYSTWQYFLSKTYMYS